MKYRALFAAITLGVIVTLSACGGSSATSHSGAHASAPTSAPTSTPTSAPTSAPASLTLMVRAGSPLGQIVVDASGRTLYLFEADTTTASMCSGACAQAWPPLVTSGSPNAGSGLTQSLVGTKGRGDGTMQVTYNGHPLYYFAGDTKPGDTKGEGINAFGAGWDVVSPAGNKIEQPGG